MLSMRDKRLQQKGTLTKDQIIRRFQNLLNLIYLESEKTPSGYNISSSLFNQIQTELDFSPIGKPNDSVLKKREQIKKRYRKRESYQFWYSFLEEARYATRESAKESLMRIYRKLDKKGYYGSMTHARYSLETLELALDDMFDTNKVIFEQINSHPVLKKASKKKSSSKKKSPSKANVETEDDIPF